jgi:DNA-binding CsgD family transcriptional regulator
MLSDRASPDGSTGLLGRRSECALLDGLVAAVRDGESRTAQLVGEPGVGKTSLLEYLVGAASDLCVLRTGGVESDMELPYASVHQLCVPLLDLRGQLADPQRSALEVAFGLSTGPAPNRFLVGLAVLGLLSRAAERTPVICAVDDAQWLDRSSALTLSFVARRLLAEPVAVVFAARRASEELQGVPELVIKGLRAADANALLDAAVPYRMDAQVRERVVAESDGNPLALVELPRSLTATQLATGLWVSAAEGVSGRIEESFVKRLDQQSDETRRLLLVAAAEPVGDPLRLWSAAARLGIGAQAADAAVVDGLITIGPRVTFRHPLVRSAVYRSASPAERRAVHLALAESSDAQDDQDRRAWHLAAAATGPDEKIAVELQRSAARAQARGGLAAAAAFLERSATLSTDVSSRVDRALAAAEATLRAGGFEHARSLLSVAEASELDQLQRARLDVLRAETAFAQDRGSDAPPLLLRAARTLEPLEPELARSTYLDAWTAALFAGELAQEGNLYEVSRAARVMRQTPGVPRASAKLLDGFAALFTDGREVASPLLKQASSAYLGSDVTIEELLRWGWLAITAAADLWDYEACVRSSRRATETAREAGALAVLTVALHSQAQVVSFGGDLAYGAQLVAEANAIREATGTQVAPYGALFVGALRGRATEDLAQMELVIKEATAGGQGGAVQCARWARSVALNGLGRYPDALASARAASEATPEFFLADWALVELIEAASRTGKEELARDALPRLAEHTEIGGTDWGTGIQARSHALVCKGSKAERLYHEAIARLDRTQLRPDLARAHLLYGEWLRRESRHVDARRELRLAHAQFTGIGMEAFAERSRIELRAAGEKLGKRAGQPGEVLTSQEWQIAQLARDGLTNPEIGGRLFLSPRTVEYHLRKVFTKLDITSRRDLRVALSVSEDT